MTHNRRTLLLAGAAALAGAALPGAEPAYAASAAQIAGDARAALNRLYAAQPKARQLGSKALAILVFPKIIKGGLIIGGQSGDGALLTGGKVEAYYNLSAASFGLQAGGQTFSYALFFMNAKALDYLRKSDGWAIGSGPNVVVMDKGAAASITSTTLSEDVYAVPFGQQGLMAGLGLEGSKITQIHPS
ncbi:MAG: twin-arginine translocation pathway signal protein [Proteobacteria bacterium]|nr:twin-arginine translocation pathway signal protein [Pseudomonadota bacterium]